MTESPPFDRRQIPEFMVPIVHTLRTKDERDEARDGVTQLEAALFRSGSGEMNTILNTKFSSDTADAVKKALENPEIKDHPETIMAFLKDMQKIFEKLPLLKLSIAFKPTENMIKRLSVWTQQNMGSGIILDIGYDRSVIGGVRIIFEGRYKEITLAQMITDVLAKERMAIKKIIS